MCEVIPYMVSVATKRSISVIYHSFPGYISYIPQFVLVYQLYTTVCHGISVIYHSAALLISTTDVVYICTTFTPQIKGKPVHIYISHIALTQNVNDIYALLPVHISR